VARLKPCPFKAVERMGAFLGLKPQAPSGSCDPGRFLASPCRVAGVPSGAKAQSFFWLFAARLKSCPDASAGPSGVFPQPVKSCPFTRQDCAVVPQKGSGSRAVSWTEAPSFCGSLSAPFDCAQGRLVKPCPFKAVERIGALLRLTPQAPSGTCGCAAERLGNREFDSGENRIFQISFRWRALC
jgi:hypothetical protein